MLFLLVLLVFFVAYGAAEYALHRRNLRRIPVRVQVNGTRGKSSVTRLIAAGLRAGGLHVAAKVTGTRPRFITGDSEEVPVRRIGRAGIAEQLRMVRLARSRSASAIVFENMSLDPQYQRIENQRLIRPTHMVVTNVRADHLDVMGPTVSDVARAFRRALPGGTRLFTAETERLAELTGIKTQDDTGYRIDEDGSAARNPTARATTPEGRRLEVVVAHPEEVTDEEMAGFEYVEHKENVALALAVCRDVGVARDAALAGMKRSLPDSGVLRIHQLHCDGRRFEFVNALAANDPDSIGMLWRMVEGRGRDRVVLVNCRRDRQDRSRQMAELVRGFEARSYIATGSQTRIFLHRAAELGIPADRLSDLGDEMAPSEVFEWLGGVVSDGTMVFACGNTVGYGEELTEYIVRAGGGPELEPQRHREGRGEVRSEKPETRRQNRGAEGGEEEPPRAPGSHDVR